MAAAAAAAAIIARRESENAAAIAANTKKIVSKFDAPEEIFTKRSSRSSFNNAVKQLSAFEKQTSPFGDNCKFTEAIESIRSQMETFMQMIDSLADMHERELALMCKPARAASKSDCTEGIEPPPAPAPLPGVMPPSSPYTPATVFDTTDLHMFEDVTKSPPSLKDIIIKGTDDEIKALLEAGACPNEELGRYKMFGKDFETGTPLVIAVLRGKMSLMHMLIEYGADPDSEYSFEAGAEQIIWSGTAIHGTIPASNLPMMEALLDARADLHTLGSNKSTLLWQAAYFGKPQICEFLLQKKINIEQRAQGQDDMAKTYTPLHAAARAGNFPIVQLLLKNKAEICVDDTHGSYVLDDAISQGHNDVVQLLVTSSANLFRQVDGRTRTIDALFSRGDPMMVAAVAQGLQKAPKLLNRLPANDLCRFLLTEGDSPVRIMASIMQPYRMLFWDVDDKGKKVRILRTAAMINAHERMAVADGPHNDVIVDLFNKKDSVEGTTKDFVHALAAVEPVPGQGKQLFVPSTFFMCHVPNMHTNLSVLLAFVDCPNDSVFGELSTRAAIQLMWRKENFAAKCRMVIAAVEVLNLVLINVLLNELAYTPLNNWLLQVANILASLVLLLVVFLQVLLFMGYISNGLLSRILLTPNFWTTNIVILLTGAVVYFVAALNFDAKESVLFSSSLGAIIFVKWMRLLLSLSTIKMVGLRILPITSTMLDIGPFCAVMGVYLIGSTNMYYALGIYSFPRCFLIVYRLVVMADVDPNEMENVWPSRMKILEDGAVRESISLASEYYVVVRLMLIFMSFVIGLTMMNLFVAVLCLAYDKAARNADFAFARNTSRLLLDHAAMRGGYRSLKKLCSKRHKAQVKDFDSPIARSRTASQTGLDPREADQFDLEKNRYIWFTVQKDD